MNTAPNYRRLIGRRIQVDLDGRRVLRVVAVDAGRRKGLRSIRAAGPSYEGRRPDGRDRWAWHGRVYRVGAELVLGVLYRRQLVPVGEFCSAKGRS